MRINVGTRSLGRVYGTPPTEHTPTHYFACNWCPMPWPCKTERQKLLARFHGKKRGLLRFLQDHMTRFMAMYPNVPNGDTRERFLLWAFTPEELEQWATPPNDRDWGGRR